MSYNLLSETRPKARKVYRCIWCPERIALSDLHVHEVSTWDGQFQDHRWHLECWEASLKYYAANPGECEFYPHECKRGSSEHC